MSYAQRIYDQAKKGTPNNPGLPETLARLVVSQARHETADFTSSVFAQDNNAFGYKYYAGSAYQVDGGRVSPEGDRYAHYSDVEDSTKEIIDWLYRRMRQGTFPPLDQITSADQYAQLLRSAGYYTDPVSVYAGGLRRFVFSPAGFAAGGALLVVALLYWFFIRKQ